MKKIIQSIFALLIVFIPQKGITDDAINLKIDELFRIAIKSTLSDDNKSEDFFQTLCDKKISKEVVTKRISDGFSKYSCLNHSEKEYNSVCNSVFEILSDDIKFIFVEFVKWQDGENKRSFSGGIVPKLIFRKDKSKITYLGIYTCQVLGIKADKNDFKLYGYWGASYKVGNIVSLSNNLKMLEEFEFDQRSKDYYPDYTNSEKIYW